MTRGGSRWENRDLRRTFPLPSERKSVPRFDGAYRSEEGDELRFAFDGDLTWDGIQGQWHVHGDVLHVRTASRECEGAIDATAVYLLCVTGEGRDAREQLVMKFAARS